MNAIIIYLRGNKRIASMTFILNEGKERKFKILISKFENKIFCPHQSNLSGWSGDTTTGMLSVPYFCPRLVSSPIEFSQDTLLPKAFFGLVQTTW